MVTIRSHHRPGTHSWLEPSWCNIMPGRARRGRLRRCAPRLTYIIGRRAPAPWACKLSRSQNVAALEAVIGHQLLVEVLGREVPVAGVEQLQHPRHLVTGALAPRGGPGGGRRDRRLLRSGRASAGRCAPMTPRTSAASAWLKLGQPKPPRTSSISVPVPAPSDASPPSMAWRRSKTGQIIWYINRTYRVLPTPP